MFKLVEINNELAIHGIFDSEEGAKKHLKETIPLYVQRGYFMNKTLTADIFKIIKG
jgi:hypothetical protein